MTAAGFLLNPIQHDKIAPLSLLQAFSEQPALIFYYDFDMLFRSIS